MEFEHLPSSSLVTPLIDWSIMDHVIGSPEGQGCERAREPELKKRSKRMLHLQVSL